MIPPPLVNEDGKPLLVCTEAGAAQWAAQSAHLRPAGTGGGEDGEDGDENVLSRVVDEDVDADDVAADGRMFNDERGAVELQLTGCQALNAGAQSEVPEPAIPKQFSHPDAVGVTTFRILDNFYLCGQDGYAPGWLSCSVDAWMLVSHLQACSSSWCFGVGRGMTERRGYG